MARDFCIIGAGTVGTALAYLLSRGPWEFVGAASRSFGSARRACKYVGDGIPADNPADLVSVVDLVFITTPDDAIADVCGDLADENSFRRGMVVAHCSGALGSDVLADSLPAGVHAGSLHPLQTFATIDSAVDLLPGTYCCLEGDKRARQVLQDVVETMGARPFTIPTEKKPLYHAAAVMACNYLTVLEGMAVEMGKEAGMEEEIVLQAMMPLIRGTVQNLGDVGLPDALTGPIARGDVETVERHLTTLRENMPDLLPMYGMLGRKTVELAEEQGNIGEDAAAYLRKVMETAAQD